MKEKELNVEAIKADAQSGSNSFIDSIRADLCNQDIDVRILCNSEDTHRRTLNEDLNRHLTYTKDDDT